jgi:hypothetical protein
MFCPQPEDQASDQIVIAIDPHKASWAAVGVDSYLQPLGAGRAAVGKAGYQQLRKFARRWPEAIWAIEGVAGRGAPLTARLTEDQITVVDVPAKLTRRVRLLSAGHSRTTDETDALSAGIAAHTTTRLHTALRTTLGRTLRGLALGAGGRGPSAGPPDHGSGRADLRVAELDTTLTELHGNGDLLVAKILARTAGVSRFRSAATAAR